LGVLLYEGGQFGEAQARFAAFPKQYPTSPLKNEAELRLGFCQVQAREYPEAIKTLSPLIERDRMLADQALYWIGKAQVGMAPDASTNFASHQKAILAAQGAFIQAANRAEQIANVDPDAKQRRGQVLLELADTQHQLKQGKEAAATYNQILNDKLLPQRTEEIHQRLITALHLSGEFNESDKMCEQFLNRYPQSTLLPLVLFRQAENSFFRMLAAEKANNNPKELAKFQDEAIRRYTAVVEKYPESPQVNLARHSLGLTLYRKGDLDEARKTWAAIPQADQNGDLAGVPYLMADCLLRLAPRAVPEDALEAGKLEEQLKKAVEYLEAFIGGQPKARETPDALLKLGLCHQRLATILGQPAEKTKALASARASYERIMGQFGQHKLMPQAVMERAKCMAQMNDANGAINELRRFTNDPLQKASIAPMALLELATLLRGQNKAAEGAGILAKGRDQHEGALGKDPERSGWVALLRYHHGLCLKEAGKLPEARAAFDLVMKQSAGKPEAVESALRFGQCLAEEGQRKVESAKKMLAGKKKPEEIAIANKLLEDGYKGVSDALQFLEGQAEQLKKQTSAGDVRARLLYETAWGYRFLGERDLAKAREAKIQELIKKRPKEAANLPPPEIPLKDIPLQASEKKARGHYRTLIDGFPDLPLATEARFELAELLSERHQYTEALKLLSEALDKEPPPELTDKIRIRMGVVHFAKGDRKAAFAQFNAVALNPKSPLAGQAHYRAGECLMHDKEWAEAVKRFLIFRDQPQFQNIPGVSDRALLRLGQAYAHLKNWDASRQAHERLAGTFGNSPWVDEARYGIGWAFQQQKQYDQAVNAYNQVTARTATETAAKAQLQIGLSRLEQKRYQEAANALLVVPFTYDYPDLSAAALLEGARAFTALKENTQAIRLLERLIRDYPQSAMADAARERLKEIRKMKEEKKK
jgi:TolA-binding protein